MTSISRRTFLKVGGGVAASAAFGVPNLTQAAPSTPAVEGRVNLPYQMKAISKAQKLQVNMPVLFAYPDAASPCALLKMGAPVPGGVGPDRDIVAFSTLCTHMGCPVAYDAERRLFKCPCHFSIFDPEHAGQMVSGQATESLPSVVLEYNPQDDSVRAVAVEGLIYGRQSNLL
ncbi:MULTISPECIES: arsenate reductase (azurin) small subunit [unclassified Pseudomonas]|uniref:arsenate reductase (azurin) small subunit n=1 Tax=unclassified Pseudomonas TaxID=196821 RepID=UPI000C88ACFB|nr:MULTISPECIES: arsenate reductase (azurin) small subunit [unclassified Pseudomonas]PMZ88457.1 arsenate reductase (azurin) small subunit [Pseudomonas sp. FW215-T2]PNA16648.1 arsenate reductase (azurin) small subunit [Pseudomonas sp. FW215-R3]PNB36411.1 arsenate reductase (azurin) small subunit [Pseudomonas sp. FW305-131]